MSDRIPSLPGRRGRAAALLAASLLAMLAAARAEDAAPAEPGQAQPEQAPPPFSEIGPPPSFTPPPPPSFTPPGRPPLTARPASPAMPVPPQGPDEGAAPAPARALPALPARPVPAAQPAEQELLQRPSALVDASDPRMSESVGLIRIPDMGTNEVIEMLENFTLKPVLRQQTLPTVKITFFSQGALTRGEAITAIESLLSLNGIAITTLGDKFLKAIPSAIINAQVPRQWEGSTLGAVPSQMIYEKIFELDFLTAAEAVTLLQPLMSQGAPVAFDKSSLILVTDALVNLQRIERLLPVLDKPGRVRSEMLFFELQNIKAEEVARRFQQLMTGALKNQLENNTTVEPDERTNQLIVFTHPSNKELVTRIVERLDIDVAPVTATKVFSIRYADATEVVNIIDQVVSGQREIRSESGGADASNPAAQAARARAAAQLRQSNQAVATARAESSNLQFSDFLTIVPDERANTIVASGTHSDLTYLQQLIEQIDTLLAQVRIEVVITEVGLTDKDTRGIDSFGVDFKSTSTDIDINDPNANWTLSPGNLYGISFSDIKWGPGGSSMGFVLNAAKTKSNISVLSAPTIVTTHNKEATVSVGQERPVITSVIRDTSSTTLSTSTEQVQYRDIKLELKVTPLIGSDGVVQLEIDQKVQTIVDKVLVNGNEQPVVGTRSATSYVSVRDGELIALGGLQSLDDSTTRGSMAILGKIPLLGELFRSKNKEQTRTELLIFIRPTIIRDTDAANTDANKMIDVLESGDTVRDYLDTGSFREREPAETDKPAATPRRFSPR